MFNHCLSDEHMKSNLNSGHWGLVMSLFKIFPAFPDHIAHPQTPYILFGFVFNELVHLVDLPNLNRLASLL